MLLGVLLAVLTALSNGASNLLQRKANREENGQPGMSVTLIWRLLHRPVWLAGLAAIAMSFLLQAAALRLAPLSVVQPIIIVELPLTLIGASRVFNAPMGRRDWISVAAMTVGLAAVIAGLDPAKRMGHGPSAQAWLVGAGACAALVMGLVVAARRYDHDVRASLLGAAAGIGFGTTAAFTNSAMAALNGGMVGLFESWSTYAMVATGIASMLLMQNALHAGRLIAAQPGITLMDPFVAILWGVLAFHERTNTGIALAVVILGAGSVVAGAVGLSRSPVLDVTSDSSPSETLAEQPSVETYARTSGSPDRAWEVARDMIRELLRTEGANAALLAAVIEVTDEEGDVVLEFPFSEAIFDLPAQSMTRH